jgi:hypothetical protein
MPAAATAARTAPIGSGILHHALEEARDRANLQAFCHAVGCAPADASSDGIHVDMPRVFEIMRQRGYTVGQPAHAPCQVRKGRTIWHVAVTLPAGGPSLALGYLTPNTS